MTRYLLDINILIALIDPSHIMHDSAHDWFGSVGKGAWATCPLTENGVLRIVGNPRYPSSPGTPGAVADLMNGFLDHPGHEFWPDNIRLFDDKRIHATRLLDSAQITDSYLLALAVSHRGKLATFDKRLVTDAVVNGRNALTVIR